MKYISLYQSHTGADTLYINAETSVHVQAQTSFREDRPTFSPTSNPSL